jgi:TrmH family RNA methyltransferase
MLSKRWIKLIRSLEYKKFRIKENLFIAEGDKLVTDLLKAGFDVKVLIGTDAYFAGAEPVIHKVSETIVVNEDEIIRASHLKNPQQCMALCRIPQYSLPADSADGHLLLLLDSVQDPGNLGTIVRLACWFGIRDIICSTDTADIYSPRAVQATMGAISQVRTHYTDPEIFLSATQGKDIHVVGTYLEGENIYTATLPSTGIVVIGNEGNGIRESLLPFITRKLTIPRYPSHPFHTDSLNVATATAIVLSEFRRKHFSE